MKAERQINPFSSELRARFLNVDPATIGHYIAGGFMRREMKPVNPAVKMIGPAYTVRLVGKDSAMLYYALKHAPKGQVIVIDRCGDQTFACVGEMVALLAQQQGFAGIVIDGPATDSIGLGKMDFPVFCTGISVVTTTVLGISGEREIPISCCGAHVNPGDLIFGDADGVVVLPPTGYEDALQKAEAAIENEKYLRAHFLSGGFAKIDIDRLIDANVLDYISDLKKIKR